MTPVGTAEREGQGVTRAWVRALELTAPLATRPHRVFPAVIDELAAAHGGAPALLSEHETLSYQALAARSNRYARWALDQGVAAGDTVCLLMPNRPEYLAAWLGITRVGGVVALVNTNLAGPALAHAVRLVTPTLVIVDAGLVDALTAALPALAREAAVWVHGGHRADHARLERELERYPGEPLREGERRAPTLEDRALYIYTSGTTGAPKAAVVSHFRIMQWAHWFAGMLGTGPDDRMYNCLPMYHSVGGVVAPGAVLVGGGSVVVREKFSAARFWDDVTRGECTLFQYIGELCRYLLHAAPSPREAEHRIRMACGNGLRPDVWSAFQRRFRIPRILEFYAATEGNVSLFNVEGRPGAIGRIPPFLAHRVPTALVRFDVERGEPAREAGGRCVRCEPGEVGEAIGRIGTGSAAGVSRFEGYTSREASEGKILRDVFEPGDAWFRTGDLMRTDTGGYFYFVDRVGDTFRWKGENVATAEVAEAIGAFPGVRDAAVYGVPVPGTEGRAGMAAIVADAGLDLMAFRAHLGERLPVYARPLFLRVRPALEVTATFKHATRELARQGYDPEAIADTLYFDDPERRAFVRLDPPLYERIRTGRVRL